jgi:hypothetical protein
MFRIALLSFLAGRGWRLSLLGLLCVACAGPQIVKWRHPDGTNGFKLAWYECERDARVTVQRGRGVFSGTEVLVDEEFRDRCMEARGWTQSEEGKGGGGER